MTFPGMSIASCLSTPSSVTFILFLTSLFIPLPSSGLNLKFLANCGCYSEWQGENFALRLDNNGFSEFLLGQLLFLASRLAYL